MKTLLLLLLQQNPIDIDLNVTRYDKTNSKKTNPYETANVTGCVGILYVSNIMRVIKKHNHHCQMVMKVTRNYLIF